MLQDMSASELAFWQHVYDTEFIGADRDYFAAAQVRSTIANFAGRQLATGEDVNAVDLMPFIRTSAEPEDDELTDIDRAEQIKGSLLAFMGLQQNPALNPPKE